MSYVEIESHICWKVWWLKLLVYWWIGYPQVTAKIKVTAGMRL